MSNKTRYEIAKDNFIGIVEKLVVGGVSDIKVNEDFKHWITYRKLHAEFLTNGYNSKFYSECEVTVDSFNSEEKNIFFLFHYGPYFSIPLHFMERFNYTGAAFILTSKSINFELIESCANSFGHDLEPIVIDESGFFVKKVIKAKNSGKCIFILVDLPAGSDDKSYKMFDAKFGRIKHRLGYMRIASMLKQKPSLLVPDVADDYKKMHIRHIEVDSHEDVVSEYLRLLESDYKNFERINELKKMCDFT